MSDREVKTTKRVLIIGNEPMNQYIFDDSEYDWTIRAEQLPITIQVKSKKNGNMLEFFTTETVEVKYFNITPKNKVKET